MSLAAPSPPLRELTGRQIKWIGGGYISMFSSLGGQTLFIALFGAAIRGEFALSDGEYGLLYTAATLCSAICLLWAGTLADKVPAALLGAGMAMGLALTALGMSLAPNVIVLGILLFGLRFFGQGMLVHNAATALSRWFNRFRGRALAISNLGLNTGEAVLPVLVALGIAAIGWRNVWMITAGVLALVLVPAILYCFSNPPDGRRARSAGTVNPDAGSSVLTGRYWTRRRVLADPVFWALAVGAMVMPALSTAIFFHQTNLVAEKGWDLLTFAGFFPVMSVTAVTFSLVAGWMVDRFGAYSVLPVLLIPLGLAGILIATLDGRWTIPLFFLLAGMSGGMFGTTINALWAEIYGTAHLGAIRAIATAAVVLASALGPGIVGVFIDAGVSVPAQGPAFALCCFGASALYLALRKTLAARTRTIRAEGS